MVEANSSDAYMAPEDLDILMNRPNTRESQKWLKQNTVKKDSNKMVKHEAVIRFRSDHVRMG